MASLLNNTATQDRITSNNGSNILPKLEADSHFFLDSNSYTQSSNQSFGVVNNNEFRCTSTVAVQNKKIISICASQVFIQPNSQDNQKINLILKPYKQPVKGLAIKYFIYRGLP